VTIGFYIYVDFYLNLENIVYVVYASIMSGMED